MPLIRPKCLIVSEYQQSWVNVGQWLGKRGPAERLRLHWSYFYAFLAKFAASVPFQFYFNSKPVSHN